MQRDAVERTVAGGQLISPRGGGHRTRGEDLDVPTLQSDEVFTQQAQPMFDASDHVHAISGDHQSQLHLRACITTR